MTTNELIGVCIVLLVANFILQFIVAWFNIDALGIIIRALRDRR